MWGIQKRLTELFSYRSHVRNVPPHIKHEEDKFEFSKRGTLLGKGSYGSAYKVLLYDKEYCIKHQKVDETHHINLKNEENILNSLINIKNEFVFSVYDVQNKLDRKGKIVDTYHVTECITLNNGQAYELFDLILDGSEYNYKMFSHQLYTGVQFLHSNNIFHCDLKPENIMVTQDISGNYSLKIIDFGLGSYATNEEEARKQMVVEEEGKEKIRTKGSLMYVLPGSVFETSDNDKRISFDLMGKLDSSLELLRISDLWSLLCIMFTLKYKSHFLQVLTRSVLIEENLSIYELEQDYKNIKYISYYRKAYIKWMHELKDKEETILSIYEFKYYVAILFLLEPKMIDPRLSEFLECFNKVIVREYDLAYISTRKGVGNEFEASILKLIESFN